MKNLLHQRTLSRLTLSMLLALFSVASWGNELTVHDGTATSNKVPINVYYFDDFSKSQVVIPAADLQEMTGGRINSITFYTNGNNIPYTTVSSADIFLKEVDYTTISAFEDIATGTTVFTGYLEFVQDGSGGKVTIVFNNPYLYTGGNLLIGVQNTEDTGWKSIMFWGEGVTGASIYGRNGTSLDAVTSATQADFIPKTTFDYTPNTTGVPIPHNLKAINIKPCDATLTWEDGTGLFSVEYKRADETEWTLTGQPTTQYSLTLSDLAPQTTYNARVRSINTNDQANPYSLYINVTFTTLMENPAPTNVTVKPWPNDGTRAMISWTENGYATEWAVKYWMEGEENSPKITYIGESSLTLTDLVPEAKYYVQVAPWVNSDYGNWSETVAFRPTSFYYLIVNDATETTNDYVPVYGYYCDNLTRSQFIIPSSSLQDILFANIHKLTFHAQQQNVSWNTESKQATFKVYLAETNETAFTGDSPTLIDWSTMENVYEGTLYISDYEMTISFDTPYQYQGNNLLIGIEQTEKAGFLTSTWHGVSTQSNTAIGGYDTTLNFFQFLPKTTISYLPGEAPKCIKPTSLNVSEITDNSAVVSWTSDEPAWDLMVNDEVIENVTNPYTLTNLQSGTNYEVKVRAKNNNGTSDWTVPVKFMTEITGEKCFVTLDLVDSYGDGWNGNAIQVVDVLTGHVFGTATIESLSSEHIYKTASVDIEVVAGREVNFVWVKGSYSGECSFTITSPDEDVIAEIEKGGASDWANGYVIATYTVDCRVSGLRTPTDLAVSEIGPRSAVLDWTENGEATKWIIEVWKDNELIVYYETTYKPFTIPDLLPETVYSVRVCPDDENIFKWSELLTFTTTEPAPAPTNLTVDAGTQDATLTWSAQAQSYNVRLAEIPEGCEFGWLQYDNDKAVNESGVGSSSEGTFTWGVMYPGEMVTANQLIKVAIYELQQYNKKDFTLNIYSGGDDAPGTLIYTATVTPMGTDGWHEVTMNEATMGEPLAITPGENLWITLTETGTYVMPFIDDNEPNNQWILTDEGWDLISNITSQSCGWLIRGYIETSGIDYESFDWTTATTNNTQYQITGLTPQTTYIVQVQGNYGNDGLSQWATTSFTTQEANIVPTDLAAETTHNSADVSWTGTGKSYDIQYRKVGLEFYDGFENELENWTNIDADGDSYPWMTTASLYEFSQYQGYEDMSNKVYEGNVSALSGSFINYIGQLTPDNWLVSPKVDLGGTISFWAQPADNSYPADVFGVFVSTSDDPEDLDSYVEVKSWTMTSGGWRQFNADLSQFDGQGYVAIRHYNCTDQYMLVIDEVIITKRDADEWTTITTTENNVKLTKLEAEAIYEVRVRSEWDGVKTDFSDVLTFQTKPLDIPTAITEVNATEGNGNWYSIDGKKLNARPKAKGLYIRNGQKVVVK
ncbi:MAG: fibronectin type III domain-containing protein [Prevotella sp.]|nr:fibronectin type III domain-containing protein [Prevotella sp.]